MKYKLAFMSILVFLATTSGIGESFRNPFRIATTSDPAAVLVSDLNGDKRMDILWTTSGILIGGPSTVQAFLAQPDGSFAAGPVLTLPSGVRPYCRVADETGDGIPDLICPYYSQPNASLMVFPGNGDGTFGNPIETALPQLDLIIGQPADFNGDSVADFVVGGAETPGYVLLGNGDGTFRVVTQKDKSASYQLGGQYQALDVNGDGHLDLLFTNGEVLLGDGTGQFTQPPNGGGVGLGFCTFGKLAGEPHIDEACGQDVTVDGDIVGGTQLLIFHGNGDGSFNPTPIKTITYGDRTNEYNGYGTFGTPIAMMDLNGDGIPDIVAEAGDGLTVLLGKPSLNFSYPAHYATGFNPLDFDFWGRFIFQIADVNGDGLPDLIESGPNGIYITYGRPDGVFDTAPAYEVTQSIAHATVADFNGDGVLDIAATGDHAIELSLGEGDGTFQYRKALPNAGADFSAASNAHIVHGDFNGDHHQDILAVGSVSSNQYNDYIFFGHGNGTFTTPAPVKYSSSNFPIATSFLVNDFNGDGKDDLFAFDPSDLYVALSNGDGSFKAVSTPVASNALNTNATPAIADLKGDGKLDAIFGGYTNVKIFMGLGNGSFNASGLKLAIPAYDGVSVQYAVAVAVGDFDGDGHMDIALLATAGYSDQPPTDAYQSVLFVYWGKGDGSFSAAVPVAAFDRGYSSLYAADLNKDGLADLVLTSDGGVDAGAAVGIVHSLPGRAFGPEVNYCAGLGLADLSIADLNGDGFPDLVFGNGGYEGGASSVTVLMNLGNTTGVTGSVYALPEPSDAAKSFQLVASLVPPDQSTLKGNVSFFVDGQPAGSAALADNQAGIVVKTALAAGLHTLKATWPGSGDFAALTLTGKHQVTVGYPTSTSVDSNYSYGGVPFLTSITFTATVQSTSGAPAGLVAFLDGESRLALLPLSGGSVTYATTHLVPGTHNITAEYMPEPGWAASSGTLQQQIDPVNATAKMTVSSTHVYALQAIELTATVKAPAGGPMPTGTVQFSSDLSPIGTSKLVNGTATLTASVLTPGYHSLSAEYNGNQDYNPTYAEGPTINALVNPTVTHVQATPNPASAGQSVKITAIVTSSTVTHPAPTGSVEFYDNGGQIGDAQLVHGSASITFSSLAVGKHPIVVSYSGVGNFSASRSTALSLVIRQATSTTTLSATPNPATVGTKVTLRAVAKGPRPPTGSIVFLDGTQKLTAAIPVDFEGTATFSTTTLAAGAHTIVADYPGDPNLDASASAPLTVTINQ